MTPVRLAWLVVCHRVIVDQVFNDLTMFSCIDEWSAAAFPAVFAGMEIVGAVYRPDGDATPQAPTDLQVRLVVHPPLGRQSVVAAEGPFRIDGLRARARFTLSPFSFLTPGRYWFGLEWLDDGEWKELGRTPIDLSQAPSPDGGPPDGDGAAQARPAIE